MLVSQYRIHTRDRAFRIVDRIETRHVLYWYSNITRFRNITVHRAITYKYLLSAEGTPGRR